MKKTIALLMLNLLIILASFVAGQLTAEKDNDPVSLIFLGFTTATCVVGVLRVAHIYFQEGKEAAAEEIGRKLTIRMKPEEKTEGEKDAHP